MFPSREKARCSLCRTQPQRRLLRAGEKPLGASLSASVHVWRRHTHPGAHGNLPASAPVLPWRQHSRSVCQGRPWPLFRNWAAST